MLFLLLGLLFWGDASPFWLFGNVYGRVPDSVFLSLERKELCHIEEGPLKDHRSYPGDSQNTTSESKAES